MLRIILTGPESSGKTTLCKDLSSHYNLPLINEYARKFLNTLDRKYNKDDLLYIANNQLESEKQESSIIFCDTDLITIKIWSEYKYASCNYNILKHIKEQINENRIYLLCYPDISWEFDELRENKYNRIEIFNLYVKELEELGHNYFIIKGNDRFNKALGFIENYLKLGQS